MTNDTTSGLARKAKTSAANATGSGRAARLKVQGNGSSFHHARMRVLLHWHPEIKSLMGYDRRNAAIVVATAVVHWLVTAVAASWGAADATSLTWWSILWPIALSATMGSLLRGVYYNQLHEAMHNLCWPTEIGNRLCDIPCMATPFRDVRGLFKQTKGHVRVHHANTFSKRDFDTTEDLYDKQISFCGVDLLEALTQHPVKRFFAQIVDALLILAKSTVAMFVVNPVRCALIAGRAIAGQETASVVSLPDRLPAWLFVATQVYQLAFFASSLVFARDAASASSGGAASAKVAVIQVLIFMVATEFHQHMPYLPFTGGIAFSAMDHLLAATNNRTGCIQPSYSILNPIVAFLSLGFFYHFEHHDVARVPSWKLHLVREMAPAFYRRPVEFSCTDRLSTWFAKRWTAEEAAAERGLVDSLRRGEAVMDLLIDEAAYSEAQLREGERILGLTGSQTDAGLVEELQ